MSKLKYHKMWEALASVFYIDPGSILPITQSLPKVASYADKYWFFYSKKGANGGAYYEEGEMEKAKEAGLKDFLNDSWRDLYFKEVEALLEKKRSPLGIIETSDVHKISNEELKKLIVQATQYLIDVFGYYLACQPQCVAGIEQKIQKELASYVPQDKIGEIFTLLSMPTKTTSLRREDLDWLQLLIVAKKGNLNEDQIKKEIEDHQRKYHLLHVGDGAKILSVEYFQQKFEDGEKISLEALEEKFANVQKSTLAIEHEKSEVIKKYGISDTVKKIADILAEVGHWRLEMRIQGWAPVQYYHEILAKEAGRRLGISDDKIMYATYDEVLSFFDGKKPDTELFDVRAECYLSAIEDGVAKVYAGKEAEQKFNELVEKIDLTNIKEIRGNVAMKGKVTGVAVVFRWGDDMNAKIKLMGENTILVAGQTRPQLMPLISKSKAIVTDEGGITSHAAIVSRELGIPCVIGTKIATLAIKDGDMVEVDAEKGVIRILQ